MQFQVQNHTSVVRPTISDTMAHTTKIINVWSWQASHKYSYTQPCEFHVNWHQSWKKVPLHLWHATNKPQRYWRMQHMVKMYKGHQMKKTCGAMNNKIWCNHMQPNIFQHPYQHNKNKLWHNWGKKFSSQGRLWVPFLYKYLFQMHPLAIECPQECLECLLVD